MSMTLDQIEEDIERGEGLHRELMIQIGRFDQLGSGVTNINKYLPYYAKGAKPRFEETRHGFELTIPLAEDVAEQATEQVTEQVAALLHALKDKELRTRQLMEALDLKHRPTFLYDYLQPALAGKWIEMTQPDSPKSPTQKYRLTAKGKQQLEGGKF